MPDNNRGWKNGSTFDVHVQGTVGTCCLHLFPQLVGGIYHWWHCVLTDFSMNSNVKSDH